jgi:hypothetical protein
LSATTEFWRECKLTHYMYCLETAEQQQLPSETLTLLRLSHTDQNTLASGEAAWISITNGVLYDKLTSNSWRVDAGANTNPLFSFQFSHKIRVEPKPKVSDKQMHFISWIITLHYLAIVLLLNYFPFKIISEAFYGSYNSEAFY